MKNNYHKLLSFFFWFKPNIHNFNLNDFKLNFKTDALKYPEPVLNKHRETYVLIRNLLFHPEIKINIMQEFKSLLKWNVLNMHYFVIFRNYPVGFFAELNEFAKKEFILKTTNTLSLDSSDINIGKKLKINEEITQILPYVRKMDNKKLFKIPIIKRPVYKSYFSREQIRFFREELAAKNKTGWANIEIFEIYDKLYLNLFSNIKQVPESKNLACNPNISALNSKPETSFYLIIGKKRDTGQPVKTIINPTDIKKMDFK